MDRCHRQFRLCQKLHRRHRQYQHCFQSRLHRYQYPHLGLAGNRLPRLGYHHHRYLGYLDLSLHRLPRHHLNHHRQSLHRVGRCHRQFHLCQKRRHRHHLYRHCLLFHLRLYRYPRLGPVGSHLLHLGYRHHLYLGY